MDPRFYPLVEIAFTASLVAGFAVWQLRSVNRALREGRKARETQSAGERRPGEP